MCKIIIIILINFIFSQFSLKLIAEDFEKPIYAVFNNNYPELIYVVEQSGIIWIINNGIVSDNPFLDIEDRVHNPLFPGDERGLLGCSFDKEGDYIYLNYIDKKDNTIISRFNIFDNYVDVNSENVIMKFKQPYSIIMVAQ